MKIKYYLLLLIFLASCGYPDVDNVPNFKDISLSEEEINDYCSTFFVDKKNIDNCINDYKSKN